MVDSRPGKDDSGERRREMALEMERMSFVLDANTAVIKEVSETIKHHSASILLLEERFRECPEKINKISVAVFGNGHEGIAEVARKNRESIEEHRGEHKELNEEVKSMWFRVLGALIISAILAMAGAAFAALQSGIIK